MSVPVIAWPSAPAPPTLGSHEVHVWCAVLSEVRPAVALGVLSPEEEARGARLHFDADRQHFIASHYALRAIVGAYLCVDPARVRFASREQGKPYLPSHGLAFSFTHSAELGLVALSLNRDAGIDIERLREFDDLEALGEKILSTTEKDQLRSLPPEQRRRRVFASWTRWEAYLKAIGVGLTGLDDPKAHDWWRRDAAADGELISTGIGDWAMYHLEPAPDYVGAVAVSGVAALRSFRWSP